jgi:hypothetical protein
MPSELYLPTLSQVTSRRRWRSDQFERRTELDGLVKRPVEWAAHGVNAVRPLDGSPRFFRRHQAHRHVDATDDKYTFFGLYFAGYLGGQFAVAGIDLARFQRTSESPHHSTRGRRNDVVDG